MVRHGGLLFARRTAAWTAAFDKTPPRRAVDSASRLTYTGRMSNDMLVKMSTTALRRQLEAALDHGDDGFAEQVEYELDCRADEVEYDRYDTDSLEDHASYYELNGYMS